MTNAERKQWIDERAGRGIATKALLAILAGEGADGTTGASTANPKGRRPMSPRMAQELLGLADGAGVAGAPGRLYLARLLRWHWGYETSSGTVPPASLNPADADFIRRRAFDLADQARHYMPVLVNDRQAT